MANGRTNEAVGAVVYPAPLGADGFLVTRGAGPRFPFGRGGDCVMRFGHAPRSDLRLPRQAGWLVVAGERLAVESPARSGLAPVQVRAPGRPAHDLSPGELYSPPDPEFDVVLHGERVWVLHVRTRLPDPIPATAPGDTATEPPPLRLSAHERSVLAVYVAPMRTGRSEPATHAQAAEELHYSERKVRGDLYRIWAEMVAAGLPVPDHGDKRIAVTHTALACGLT
jgi:hypothetical protein